MISSSMIVHHYEPNAAGRDFVVGDLHGCRDLFAQVLRMAGVDPARDRVFSVGDLIDRGPDSVGCVALLAEPWFFAVRGNHEQMMIEAMRNPIANVGMWMANGGRWAGDVDGADLEKIAARLDLLPYVITVGNGDGRFNVLHAEFFGTDSDLHSDSRILRAAEARLLWGRSLISGQAEGACQITAAGVQQPGLSVTYVGHTIRPHVERIGSHVFIDTGSFLAGGRVTLIEPATGRVWAASNRPDCMEG